MAPAHRHNGLAYSAPIANAGFPKGPGRRSTAMANPPAGGPDDTSSSELITALSSDPRELIAERTITILP